jgi:hypothetical protein
MKVLYFRLKRKKPKSLLKVINKEEKEVVFKKIEKKTEIGEFSKNKKERGTTSIDL